MVVQPLLRDGEPARAVIYSRDFEDVDGHRRVRA